MAVSTPSPASIWKGKNNYADVKFETYNGVQALTGLPLLERYLFIFFSKKHKKFKTL